MEIGKTLRFRKALAWRKWLEKNHNKEKEAWLIYYSKASQKQHLSYMDALDEALCFGWIDSIVKKVDADSRAQRFTPRRPKSPVSQLNIEKMQRLIEEGKMTKAGLVTAPNLNHKFIFSKKVLNAIKKDKEAWKNYQKFPDNYKRVRIAWIQSAKDRPEVFSQRLNYFIRQTAQNKRFGFPI